MSKFFKNYWVLIIYAIIITGLIATVVSVQGCETYKNAQGEKVTRLSEDTTDVLDKATELAPAVQTGLGGAAVAFPAAAGALGIIAGSIGAFTAAYKKYRPKLVAEEQRADQYANVTKAVVHAIEQFKGTNPTDWDALKDNLRKELLDKVGPEALAIIEAIIEEYRAKQ